MLVSIQILRFFAAAAVVAFHAWTVAPNFIVVSEQFRASALQYAGHGVDLFFVISGFIIFYATDRSGPTPGVFLRRRIVRIVPVYFIVTFADIALAAVFPETFGTPGWFTLRHILKSLGFVAFTDGEMPIVYVGWSLEYEMFFYLVVAALLALKQDAWRAVVVIFSILTSAGQVPGVADALGNYAFFVDPLIMEFALGVLIGGVLVHGRVGAVGLIAAAGALATLSVADPGNRVILFGLPSAAVVAAAAWISRTRPRPSVVERVLERLGDASYSIYLAQVQSVSLVCSYAAGFFPGIAPMLLVALATAAVVLLGLLLNVAIERPLLRLSRSLGAARDVRRVNSPAV